MIIDSCILIDASRRLPAAVDFLAGLEMFGVVPAISTLTVTEIMLGVRTDQERRLFEALFDRWQVIAVDLQIALAGANYMKTYRASHNLDIVDALIATTASAASQPLATLNLKHFPMFPDLKRPY